jgi:hypothetical protein
VATTLQRPPYEAYAAIMGAFVGGLGLAGVAARALDRNPACQTPLDFAVLSVASFKAARTLSGGEVASFLREPFVRGRRTKVARSRCTPATCVRRSASS